MCAHNTDEHSEFQLLEAMSGRWAAAVGAPCSSVTRAATLGEVEASFIVQPEEGRVEDVVGYVAIQPGGGSTRDTAPTILEMWVEKEFRSQGVATAALQVLLAGCTHVAVGPPAPEAAEPILAKLGFKASRAQRASTAAGSCSGPGREAEVVQKVLFKRRTLMKADMENG